MVFSCGIRDLVPDQGPKPVPLHWEHGVLAPGPPGKSDSIISQGFKVGDNVNVYYQEDGKTQSLFTSRILHLNYHFLHILVDS